MNTTKKYSNLEDLLVLKLKSLYDTESELIKALPKMAKKATDPDLKDAFTSHFKETQGHVKRLEKIFTILGVKAQKTRVEAIRGLVEDASWVMKQGMPKPVLDAAMVGAARYVEHYEMAGYMAAAEWAMILEKKDVYDLLFETLEEEKMAEEKLMRQGEILSRGISHETVE